jgi:UDP-glucuronate 4-epimerase
MPDERFLVTGALGCIGAWVVRRLLDEGSAVVGLDLGTDRGRLAALLSEDELRALRLLRVDVAERASVERALDEHGITHVIHLAALQVPSCRADPPLGARVNVVGTLNLLATVGARREHMAPLVYASSVAAYGAALDQPPATHYGVFKRAVERSAAVAWTEDGVPSAGLRPYVVYGVGRDQGLTSAPTLAMAAVARGEPFHIPFGGRYQLQYAPDVAAAFVAASRSHVEGAVVANLAGTSVSGQDVVDAAEKALPGAAGLITFGGPPLPFPPEVPVEGLAELVGDLGETDVERGVRETVAAFENEGTARC